MVTFLLLVVIALLTVKLIWMRKFWIKVKTVEDDVDYLISKVNQVIAHLYQNKDDD
jgi:ribosomal protein S15P/S13E